MAERRERAAGTPTPPNAPTAPGKMKCHFLLPITREVHPDKSGDDCCERGENGSEGEEKDDDDDDDDEGVDSRTSLLGRTRRVGGSGRSICRRKKATSIRRAGGSRNGSERGNGRWWIDWKGKVGLWVTLVLFGGVIGFVFIGAAEECSPDEGMYRFFISLDPEREGTAWGGSKSSVVGVKGEERKRRIENALTLAILDEGNKIGEWHDWEKIGVAPGVTPEKREIPLDSKWLYAQDSANPLVPDREHLIESRNGAVSSDVEICSQIGVDLMKEGGHAVDAAIGMIPHVTVISCFPFSKASSMENGVDGLYLPLDLGYYPWCRYCCMYWYGEYVCVWDRRWRFCYCETCEW